MKQSLHKFQSSFSHLLTGTLSVLNHLLLFSGSFLLYILLVRSLDLKALGEWAVFITWVNIIDHFRQGFIHHELIRVLHQSPDKEPALISSAFLLNISIVIVLSLPFMLLGAFGLLNELFLLILLPVLASAFIQFLNTLLIAKENFKKQFILNSIYVAFSVVFTIWFYFLGNLSIWLLLLIQFASAFIVMINFFLIEKPEFSTPVKSILVKFFDFGRYSGSTNVLSILFHKSDILILNLFVGKEAIAIYHFASKVINYIEIPLNGLSQYLFPKLSRYFSKYQRLAFESIYYKSIVLMILGMLPGLSIFLLFPEMVFWLFSSPGLEDASYIIQILMIASLIKPIGRVSGLSIDAMHHPQLNSRLLLISLALNLTLNFILIPLLGISGAAIATVIAIILTIAIGQIILFSKSKPQNFQELIIQIKNVRA